MTPKITVIDLKDFLLDEFCAVDDIVTAQNSLTVKLDTRAGPKSLKIELVETLPLDSRNSLKIDSNALTWNEFQDELRCCLGFFYKYGAGPVKVKI